MYLFGRVSAYQWIFDLVSGHFAFAQIPRQCQDGEIEAGPVARCLRKGAYLPIGTVHISIHAMDGIVCGPYRSEYPVSSHVALTAALLAWLCEGVADVWGASLLVHAVTQGFRGLYFVCGYM